MQKTRVLLAAALLAMAAGGTAVAHPDHGSDAASREMFPGEGVASGQHGFTEGHLPAVNRNVRLLGKAEVFNPSGKGNEGRVADVSAYKDHAFLTAFREPTCEQAGAHVIDIGDPENPREIRSAFMPTTKDNYAGEGSQTLRVKNDKFNGVLFIHQNETCPGAPAPTEPKTRGGINIWDVTNAEKPKLLAKHAGDYTNPNGGVDQQANSTHSAFAWNDKAAGKTYVALVDNEELTDVDIMDITDPRNPVLVNDTLDLNAAPFDVGQDSPKGLTSTFLHDMVVKKIGKRQVMSASYWDGGYVLLDVTDPRPGKVTLIAESDYAALDEERLKRGHEISPEGNAHQSEFSEDNDFLVATDEDFNPYRTVATIKSGPYQGTEFAMTSASGTPPIDENTTITGTPTFVGLACGALPQGSGVALIERGVCAFQTKLNNIKAAGYSAGIVFNAVRPDCAARVTMSAAGDIPFVFVNRLSGLQLLQKEGVTEADQCTQDTPSNPTAATTTIEAIFDGWGYVRLFKTKLSGKPGTTGSIEQVDTFAIPESQDPAFARGRGDLSVHEVAVDQDRDRAYVAYYSGGYRVLDFGKKGLKETGAFIDEGGSNFWGVELHEVDGEEVVLASDRDYGLYIFDRELEKDDDDD